jgi:hypothetical protein F3_02046|nr:MAG TPA: hypothetical protein [Caudoviricetes sp.]
MSRKIGRPTDSPKNIKLQIRVDDDTLKKLDDYAKRLQSTRSGVVRKGIELVGELLDK